LSWAESDGGQRQAETIFAASSFCQRFYHKKKNMLANGERYLLAGGTR
jgi:hypothetical protein